jgi:hypothetical protein
MPIKIATIIAGILGVTAIGLGIYYYIGGGSIQEIKQKFSQLPYVLGLEQYRGLGSQAIGSAKTTIESMIKYIPNYTKETPTPTPSPTPTPIRITTQQTVQDIIQKSYAKAPTPQEQFMALTQGYFYNPFAGAFQRWF